MRKSVLWVLSSGLLFCHSAGCGSESNSGEDSPDAGDGAAGSAGTTHAPDAAAPVKDAAPEAGTPAADGALPASSFAPASGVTLTGEPVDGATLVVTASAGFGTKPDSSWKKGHDVGLPLLWDRIDNRPSYAALADGDEAPVGGAHPWDENAGVLYRTGLEARHAKDTAHYQTEPGNSWFGHPRDLAGGQLQTPADRKQLFVSWWARFDVGPYESGGSHKFVRVRAGGEEDLRVSWTQRQVTCSNGNAGAQSAISSNTHYDDWPAAPAWSLHEIWVSADDGRIQTWVNGKLRNDWESQDSRYLRRDHVGKLDLAILGWNPSHGDPEIHNLSMEMDDIWVDDTRARVVLYAGDAPFADDALGDHRSHEIQPTTSWSDSAITFTLNAGAHGELLGKRLAVVRHDGSVIELGQFTAR